MKRIAVALAALVAIAIGGAALFAVTFEPEQRPASTITVDATTERLEHGRYLVESRLLCLFCHTERDWTRFGGPPVGAPGGGGLCFSPETDFPGHVCSSNITPDVATGIGGWTDGEIMRAIREGVDRAGRALAPVMPFESFRDLSDEETFAVVAYLRSLTPVSNRVPEPEVQFPVSLFLKMLPAPLTGPVAGPDPTDEVARGRYLVKTSSCEVCHSPVDDEHVPIPGLYLSGGQVMKGPWGTVRSANITPHATGLGGITRANFIGVFHAFRGFGATTPLAAPGGNTAMPWIDLSSLSDEDLGAIYSYLQTVAPIENQVERNALTIETIDRVRVSP